MPETPVTDAAVYSARPTIRVNEQAYPLISEFILGMRMTEQVDGLSSLELRLSNWMSNTEGGADHAFEDEQVLKLGVNLNVYAGDENQPQEIFRGKVSAMEAIFPRKQPPEILIMAEDAFQQARMTRRTKTHEDLTLSDLASQVASNIGLKPVITGLTDNLGVQVQFNESDLAFLRRLLARYDGDLQVVGEEMHVSPRGDVHRGTLTLIMGDQLREARILADLAHQVTEISASGWDVSQGSVITATSTGVNLGPGSGRDGAMLLRDAFSERKHHIGHIAVADQSELQVLADSAFDERARRLVCVEGTTEGNPQLRVGTHVTIEGVGSRFGNTYYVTRVCHHYDQVKGYETDFDAECAYLGEA